MRASIRRRVLVAGIVVLAVAGAGAGTWAVVDLGAETASAEDRQPSRRPSTATVDRGDLTETQVFAGTLGFGSPVAVAGTAQGTVTWLPAPGQVIHRDEPLYAVDERPVYALHGDVPLWRELAYGDEGEDVAQLNRNLAALGYDVATDDAFGPRTLRAVKAWQRHHDRKATGTLTGDDIVFVRGDVRVATVEAVLGQPVDGTVLQATSTERVATVTVDQQQADRFSAGTAVQVVVNGAGEPISGTVSDAAPSQDDETSRKTVVTIRLDAGDRKLPDTGSVRVEVQGGTEEDVLSVPVAALVAGASADAYAVDVLRPDGTTKRVPVVPGFVADGRVAVTGKLSVGDRVVVPS